ncbi:MAG: leucine-rich repeat protein, partial [Bacteroidales bacterium]|nr:leucine-rich repeat protein [Bacteroidales bacterium]
GEEAFCLRKNLRSLTIPKSVSYFGIGALSGCDDLAKVFCQGKTPPTIGGYRKGIGYLPGCIFYVPKSTGKVYSSAPGWTKSTLDRINIIEKGTVTTYKASLKVAGTLSVVIGKDNLNKVIKLTIAGPINGTDIKMIRSELPLLRILDLGDADIVSGGESYCSKNDTTIDNVIGDNMFDYIPYWESLVLPKRLTRIGEHAILHGRRLQSITLLTKTPPVLALSSFMLNVNCKLYVPRGCDAVYAQDEGWKKFYTDYGNK